VGTYMSWTNTTGMTGSTGGEDERARLQESQWAKGINLRMTWPLAA